MRSFALVSLATLALADDQIKFFLPGMNSASDGGVDPVASIIKADASTTVMALACPTGSDDTECAWGQDDITVSVIASSVYAVSIDAQGIAFDCTSKNDMTCTAGIAVELTESGMVGFTAGNDGVATGSTVYPPDDIVFRTASVTAGVEKLSGGAAGASASASAMETGVSSALETNAASTGASPSSSGASQTRSANWNGTASQTGSAAPEQATGEASRFAVEGAALFALAVAAVAHVL